MYSRASIINIQFFQQGILMKMKFYSAAIALSIVALSCSFNSMAMHDPNKATEERFSAIRAGIIGFGSGLVGNLSPIEDPRLSNGLGLGLAFFLNVAFGRTANFARDFPAQGASAISGYIIAYFFAKYLNQNYTHQIQNR